MAVPPVGLPARCWLCGVVPLAINLLPWMLVTRRSVMLSIFRTYRVPVTVWVRDMVTVTGYRLRVC